MTSYERHLLSNHRSFDCLFNSLCGLTPVSALLTLCEGNSPVTGEFPVQRASNATKTFIWWRQHNLIVPNLLSLVFSRFSMFTKALMRWILCSQSLSISISLNPPPPPPPSLSLSPISLSLSIYIYIYMEHCNIIGALWCVCIFDRTGSLVILGLFSANPLPEPTMLTYFELSPKLQILGKCKALSFKRVNWKCRL